MPDKGLVSLAEAFASAESDLGVGAPGATEAPLPGAEVEPASTVQPAEVTPDDKPSDGEEVGEAINLDGFEELYPAGDGDPTTLDPGSQEFLDFQVSVDTVAGSESVSIQDLMKGYLRQADYTQKTQEVAASRKEAAEAIEFFKTFNADPMEFARTLAVRAELIEEGQTPVGELKVARFPSAEDLQAQVDAQVAEKLAENPEVQAASLANAREAVRVEFESIQKQHNVVLSEEHRTAIVTEANRQKTTNLNLVFRAMLSDLQTSRSRNVRGGAPARPTGGAGPTDKGTAEKVPDTVAEAFAMAQADLSGA